jgi:hypothetical protein
MLLCCFNQQTLENYYRVCTHAVVRHGGQLSLASSVRCAKVLERMLDMHTLCLLRQGRASFCQTPQPHCDKTSTTVELMPFQLDGRDARCSQFATGLTRTL